LLFQLRWNDQQLRPTDGLRLAAVTRTPYVSCCQMNETAI